MTKLNQGAFRPEHSDAATDPASSCCLSVIGPEANDPDSELTLTEKAPADRDASRTAMAHLAASMWLSQGNSEIV